MQMRTWVALGCLALAITACGDDEVEPIAPLPENPQIQNQGFATFGLNAPGESASRNIVLANLGRQPLVISDIRLSGQDAGLFSLGTIDQSTIGTRETGVIPVTFAGAGVGAYVANVTITSNAENVSSLVVDLLAGVGEGQEALLEPAEKSLDITIAAGAQAQSKVLRYYNLGVDSLIVTGYAFTGAGAASFTLANGTPEPGGACRVNEFTCPTGFFCNLPTPDATDGTCAVSVPTGNLIVLDIYYTGNGTQNASFEITSANGGDASVALTGRR